MMNNNDKGFTLVELVVVIILLTVLAATAIPKLTLTQGFEATTDRDQLIALLISVQTRAMQNTEQIIKFTGPTDDKKCFQVSFTADKIGALAQDRVGKCTSDFIANLGDTEDFFLLKPATNFTVRNLANAAVSEIGFDNWGRPVPQSAYKITFDSRAAVCIESEGYIHVCP